ncbi:hypothetical protein JXM67_13035 [candidate division WOR-3 bacterium]|nr:hypothetical protein [candidate division WOR-3 bacterium]
MSDTHYLVECHPLMRVVATAAIGLDFKPGDWVVLRFKGCEDVGCVRAFTDDPQAKAIAIRKAGEVDLAALEEVRKWEQEALKTFLDVIEKYELPMKVVNVHAWADRQKVAFYFLTERRLDFRKLHKEISTILGCRVVIKQIGTRDHARLLGGLGPCGRQLCCFSFLSEIRPISLRTARQQNLYVNPDKISGMCGRLLCCLRFEDESGQPSIISTEHTLASEGILEDEDGLIEEEL